MKNRVRFVFFAPLSLTGCAIIPPADPAAAPPGSVGTQMPISEAAEHPAETPASASLTYAALGQAVTVGRPNVTPLKVLEDSRCPANARCVWAGQVRLRIRVHPGPGTRTMEITLGKPLRIADGTLTLTDVRPDKTTGRNSGAVAQAAYRFGFGFISGL